MRVLTLIFIFSTSLFLSSTSGLETEMIDKRVLIDCNKVNNSEIAFTSLNEQREYMFNHCDTYIWQVTLYSDGSWSCTSGSDKPCYPCTTPVE